jgi:hypothetical protein
MQPQSPQVNDLPLRDIHLPDAISWWPPAPGWWILLGMLVVSAVTVYLLRTFYLSRRVKRSALDELQSIRRQYEQTRNQKQLAEQLSILMRRASISFHPRSEAASLTGKNWLDYLDSTSKQPGFNQEAGQLLISAPYLPADHTTSNETAANAEVLVRLCENWLRAQPYVNKKHAA